MLLGDLFRRHVIQRKLKDGRVSFHCGQGLWAVSGPLPHARGEAWHYFIQYLLDGEYGEYEMPPEHNLDWDDKAIYYPDWDDKAIY